MHKQKYSFQYSENFFHRKAFFFLLSLFTLVSCNNGNESEQNKKLLSSFTKSVSEEIKEMKIIDDEFYLGNEVKRFYNQKKYIQQWSDTGVFHKQAYDLAGFLDTARFCGLPPNEYHNDSIQTFILKAKNDTNHLLPSSFWARADITLTDASFRIMLHLNEGRLIPDSISILNNPSKSDSFFSKGISSIFKNDNINVTFLGFQPEFEGYRNLRDGMSDFLVNMDTAHYIHLTFPYDTSNSDDSLKFISSFCKRLKQSKIDVIESDNLPDSSILSGYIKTYQQSQEIQPDGKITSKLIRHMNTTDRYRLKRILVSLDRYKLLKDELPQTFIWVNLPAYELQAWDGDTVAVRSNIICGKPMTPTPTLVSQIKEIITFPTWTIPPGIIRNEVLPGMKRNAAYLARRGYGLYDRTGKRVDPSSVDWSKYSKGIPYSVRQGSGVNNALGVIKFNFPNSHYVYLHDTNQRNLFKNSKRAMSHGCVRVQEWEQLARWIAFQDSIKAKPNDTLKYSADSISKWIVDKKKKSIPVKKPVPLFIQYITCEGRNRKIIVHDDIYELDKKIIEKKGNESLFDLIRS
jgi:murein L,D-transpeptidase YcbB/YkuD